MELNRPQYGSAAIGPLYKGGQYLFIATRVHRCAPGVCAEFQPHYGGDTTISLPRFNKTWPWLVFMKRRTLKVENSSSGQADAKEGDGFVNAPVQSATKHGGVYGVLRDVTFRALLNE